MLLASLLKLILRMFLFAMEMREIESLFSHEFLYSDTIVYHSVPSLNIPVVHLAGKWV